MRIKCPACSAEFDLVAALGGGAGSELMLLLAEHDAELTRPLVSYLSLFRSASRALAWDRALKLCKEVLELTGDKKRLSTALSKSVEIFREKQKSGDWKPLSNHNYLKKVLADLPRDLPALPDSPSVPGVIAEASNAHPPRVSKTFSAVQKLQRLKHRG